MAHQKNTYSVSNNEFVDIHGRDVCVYKAETGDLLIPLQEIKQTGFSIYRKSQYNKLLIDDDEFNQEFNLFLLESAKSYMLHNKIRFREEETLATINNCKKILVGEQPANMDFMKDRVIRQASASDDLLIKVEDIVASTPDSKPSIITRKVHQKHPISSIEKEITSTEPEKTPTLTPLYTNKLNFITKEETKVETLRNKPIPNNHNNQGPTENCVTKTAPIVNNIAAKPETPSYLQLRLPRASAADIIKPKAPKVTIPSITFDKKENTVIVTHVESNKLAWVQNSDNFEVIADLLKNLNENEIKDVVSVPELHGYYVAMEDDCWFRCEVIGINPLKVFFIDFGNVSQVSEVRALPKQWVSIPAQAVKISFENAKKLTAYNKMNIEINKRLDNGMYFVHILPENEVKSEVVVEKARPKVFKTMPPAIYNLEDGLRAMVIKEDGLQFGLRTRESYLKFKEIENLLKQTQAPKLDQVEEGQLVLTRAPSGGLVRAKVLSIAENSTSVLALDYGDVLDVPISSICEISEKLSVEPLTLISTPVLRGFEGKKISPKSQAYLDHLVAEKEKCFVAMEGGFDLKLIHGNLLSSLLLEMEAPKVDRCMLEDMEEFKPELGLGQYMCYSFKSLDAVCLFSLEATKFIEDIIKSDMEDAEPYSPVVGEVCWGEFEGMWYRCAVQSVGNDLAETYFIDFGNNEILSQDQLRKLTDSVKTIPVLGLKSKLINYPKVENVESYFKQLINEEDAYEFDIKCRNDDMYEVEATKLYKLFQQL